MPIKIHSRKHIPNPSPADKAWCYWWEKTFVLGATGWAYGHYFKEINHYAYLAGYNDGVKSKSK